MKFKQYRLQILVDGIPLEECWEHLDNDNQSSSYVRDEVTQLKRESETIHYAAVNVNYGTRFSVRFSADDATKDQPIKAYLSVDGNWDFTYYQLTDEKFRNENGFWNKDRNKKYYFKFIPITQSSSTSAESDTINLNNKQFIGNEFSLKKSGGPGCVSVYFYRAKWVNHRCKIPNFNINQVSKEKFNENINLFTGFDEEFYEQNDDIQLGVVNLKRISKKPIAELHIHYRDISYLTNRELIFPTLLTPKCDIIREDYFEDINIKQRTELIESANTIVPIHLNQSERIDKEYGILIEEKRLDKMDKMSSALEKSNKRSSSYISEKQPSKKRTKVNNDSYIAKTTVQSNGSLDESISRSVISRLNNNVEEKLIMSLSGRVCPSGRNVNERFVEGKNLKSTKLLYDKIKKLNEVNTSSIKLSRQINSFSNGSEIVIIEDSDDNDVPICIGNNSSPLTVMGNGCGKVESSKALPKQNQVIYLSDDNEDVTPRSYNIKKRRRSKNKSRIQPSKPRDVIVLSD